MSELGEKINQKHQALQAKLGILGRRGTTIFSRRALEHFLGGFDIPIMGFLSDIMDRTKTHSTIICLATWNQVNTHEISDAVTYQTFASEVEINPDARIDFTFKLSDSYYGLGDVTETFLVYFNKDNYRIVHKYAGNEDFGLDKDYLSYLEPSEVIVLRDRIADSILNKVTEELDK